MAQPAFIKAAATIGLALITATAGYVEAQGLGGGRTQGRRTVTQTVTITEVVEEWQEVVEDPAWTPIAVVLLRNSERGHPWLNDELEGLQNDIETAFLDAGFTTVDPRDARDDVDTSNPRTILNFARGDCMIDIEINNFDVERIGPIGTQGRSTYEYELRVSARIIDPLKAAGQGRIRLERSYKTRKASFEPEPENVLFDLWDQVYDDVIENTGEQIQKIVKRLEELGDEPSPKLTISTQIQDFSFPDIKFIGEIPVPVDASINLTPTVDVLVDGVRIGSAPGNFDFGRIGNIKQGLVELTVRAPGLEQNSYTTYVYDGMLLDIPMVPTQQTRNEWRENIAFLNRMGQDAALAAANVERIKGIAQMFRQSGWRMDIRKDVKINGEFEHRSDVEVKMMDDLKEGKLYEAPQVEELAKKIEAENAVEAKKVEAEILATNPKDAEDVKEAVVEEVLLKAPSAFSQAG